MRNVEESNKLWGVLQSESDRAAAVLGAAILDDLLRQLISNYIVDDKAVQRRLLDDGHSPLSDFSSRTIAAYAFGLIERRIYDDLNIIRGIRNDFAHEPVVLSFENQSIKDRCLNFQMPERPDAAAKIPARILFNWSASIIGFVLDEQSDRVLTSRIQPAASLMDELQRNFRDIVARGELKVYAEPELPPLSDQEIRRIKAEIHDMYGLSELEIEAISFTFDTFSLKYALLSGTETASTIRAKLRNEGRLPT